MKQFIFKSIFIGLFFIVGSMFFLFQNRYLIIIKKPIHTAVQGNNKTQNFTLTFFKNEKQITETTPLLISENIERVTTQGLIAWLKGSIDHLLILPNVQLQDIAFSSTKKLIFVSFSRSIFKQQDSILAKAIILKSITLAIKELSPKTETLFLLVDYKSLHDEHIACNQGLSITHFTKL